MGRVLGKARGLVSVPALTTAGVREAVAIAAKSLVPCVDPVKTKPLPGARAVSTESARGTRVSFARDGDGVLRFQSGPAEREAGTPARNWEGGGCER